MGPPSVLITKKPLDGIHGVRVKPHAPFSLEPIHQDVDHYQSQCTASSISTSQGFLMQRAWQQRPDCMRPIHYCCNGITGNLVFDLHNAFSFHMSMYLLITDDLVYTFPLFLQLAGDQSIAETIANVMTSLPFIALGIQTPRKNLNCKLYANSLIGVGVASSLYHCSRGRPRKYLRWVDYTMIAASTVCLSRAIRNENPKLLMAASALCLPFQPLLVSAVHTGMMEVAFAKLAIENPKLKTAHNVHKLSSLLSGALFVADDLYPKTPFIHAAWHLTAAVGVGTCNKLLE